MKKKRTKYYSLKITSIELSLLNEGVETLAAMVGGGDEGFDSECKAVNKAFQRCLKRNGIVFKRSNTN